MRSAVAAAYEASACAWARGPAAVYDPLAAALVACCPFDLAGRRILDLGAGSGSVSRAARAVGARPVALDIAPAMLAGAGTTGFPVVIGDAGWLPLPDRSVDAVLAGFSLSHDDDPAAVLAECARVVERGGAVLASAFDRRACEHPAKSAIDRVAQEHGWLPPPWYSHLKGRTELRLSTPEGLVSAATDAGLVARIEMRCVDAGVDTARRIVAWRLGMAHVAPWVASLTPVARHRLEDDACRAVGPTPDPVRLAILVLVARVGQ